ncbi:MAG: DUF1778 domain-containing protein [Propionibacteriaceae bacterium]|jgi:uncharacterized protein (DUF1778 family)|nr:DUF1778 domain-containing protein [Propionibacteriaceae bacterium]
MTTAAFAPTTPLKSRRFEARIDPESDEIISRAAASTGESKSAFIIRAARQAADKLLARQDVTIMPEEQFDAMMAALDQPQSVPVLERVAARPRQFVRV